MIHTYTIPAILLGVLSLPALAATAIQSPHSISHSKYSKAYSLGDNYVFDPRDGWQSANVTNLGYKYARDTEGRSQKTSKLGKAKNLSLGGAVEKITSSIFAGLKGWGSPETVKITWCDGFQANGSYMLTVMTISRYTGHDLLNPSCWSDVDWAPTVRPAAKC
jgi:hypothetical protein